MSDSDVNNCKRLRIDDNLQVNASGKVNSDEMNSDDSSSNELERKTFSCWDTIHPEWIEDADEDEEDRIYVHREILEWVTEHIKDNILSKQLRAEVEEVHHHNLDGQVFLIKFYDQKYNSEYDFENPELRESIEAIKNRLRHKMPWQKNPTYFLKMDSGFEKRRNRIMNEFQKLNLLNNLKITTMDVNWLCIPKIEIYEFVDGLTEAQIIEIDLIFSINSESFLSLYICEQFSWHLDLFSGDYINVDTLCMDICAEEWRRYDLLKEFRMEDILELDLANKDYRDPYFNEYLDRYLDILLKKLLPQLSSVHDDERFEFDLTRLSVPIREYFVSKFYNKISYEIDFGVNSLLENYDIPKTDKNQTTLNLKHYEPPPDTLLNINARSVLYEISNYVHFSDTLFQALLNQPNEWQQYNIKFDNGFSFAYENGEQFELHPPNGFDKTFNTKNIVIVLADCVETNAGKLMSFMKYLINLFEKRQKEDNLFQTQVSINFENCTLDDYTFFENIGNYIHCTKFERMKFTSQQLHLLSRLLVQQKSVHFVNCKEIADSDIMILLEHIDFDRLYIEGDNACTPAIFYFLAEHLFNKENVETIRASRFLYNMKDCAEKFVLNLSETIGFTRSGHQVVAQNTISKQILDLHSFVNDLSSDEDIFDPENNVYKE